MKLLLNLNIGIVLSILALSSLLSKASDVPISTSLTMEPSPFKSDNQTQKPKETDKLINIGSIETIINQLLNKTSKPPTVTSTTKAVPKVTTVMPPCQCGKGGTPKVNLREFGDDAALEDDLNDFDDHLVESQDSHSRIEVENKYTEDNDTRIFHGLPSNLNAYPWMAAIVAGFSSAGNLTPSLLCGGSLINSQYVVTAGHCFNSFANTTAIIKGISVILGTNSLIGKATPKTVVRTIDVKIHPQFNRATLNNDITILKLATPITFSNTIRPICLSQTGAPFPNRRAIIAGWGATNSAGTGQTTFLREAGVNTITNAACRTRGNFTGGVTNNMICATGRSPASNSNACFGDSGGPLMVLRPATQTFSLIGLTSFGSRPCGNPVVVYTRVAKYIAFIQSVTNGTSFCSNSFT